MSVRKKLEKPKNDPVDIEALINKGAKVKEDHTEDLNKWVYISLRMPTDMLKEIDEKVSQKVGISRTGWILQAIHDELKDN